LLASQEGLCFMELVSLLKLWCKLPEDGEINNAKQIPFFGFGFLLCDVSGMKPVNKYGMIFVFVEAFHLVLK
jgi:hypothetical protein